MQIQELLQPADVLVNFDAEDKWDAIERIVDHLAERGRLPAGAEGDMLEAVLHRERSMSTGMERGLAIPHAAVDRLETVVGALAVVADPEGLPFEGTDPGHTRLIVLLLIPRAQKLQHIRTLAEVARVMSHEAVRHGLLEATSPQDAWNVLGESD